MKHPLTMLPVGLITLAAFTATTHGGRPLNVDDADPTDTGYAEAEGGVAYAYDSGSASWELPFGWGLGILPGLEAGIGISGLHEGGNEGVSDTGIGAKWQFLSSCPLGGRHALATSISIPTGDEDDGFGSGKSDANLSYIASFSINDSIGIHLTSGYTWTGNKSGDIILYGCAADWWCTKCLQWVGEIFAEDERESDTSTSVLYNTGFRYSVNDGLTLDIAGGSRINGDVPDYFATMGLTWSYSMNGK